MAMIDARQLENGHGIKADLCIVGAGPAGIAIAKEFAQSRLRVALIESGGLDFDADTWSWPKGRPLGFLTRCRDRGCAISAARQITGTETYAHWSIWILRNVPGFHTAVGPSAARTGRLLRAREGLYGTARPGIRYRLLGKADGGATMANPNQ